MYIKIKAQSWSSVVIIQPCLTLCLLSLRYYFRGDVAKWTEYLNAKHFVTLENDLKLAKSMIANSSHPDLKLWIGETSDAWHSGTRNVSDRFVSGFL